jgi:hypothetical protein
MLVSQARFELNEQAIWHLMQMSFLSWGGRMCGVYCVMLAASARIGWEVRSGQPERLISLEFPNVAGVVYTAKTASDQAEASISGSSHHKNIVPN